MKSPESAAASTPRHSTTSSICFASSLSRRNASFHRRQLRLAARSGALATALWALVRLGALGRLGAAVRRRFRDPRLHRLFSFQTMYAGLAPDAALAMYAVITYMDSIEGVWFPSAACIVSRWPWPRPRRSRSRVSSRRRGGICPPLHDRTGGRRPADLRRSASCRRRGLHYRSSDRLPGRCCRISSRRKRRHGDRKCQYQRRILSHIAVTGPLISRMNGTRPAQSRGVAGSGVESNLPCS